MEGGPNRSSNGFSYSNLFNLEPLMNFRLPQRDGDFDSSGNGSQGESISSQGLEAMGDHVNGYNDERSADSSMSKKRRKRATPSDLESASISSLGQEPESNDECDEAHGGGISEEQYRSMLGEHVLKYRKMRSRDSAGLTPTRMPMPVTRPDQFKARKSRNEPFVPVEEETTVPNLKTLPDYNDFAFEYENSNRLAPSLDSPYLDIGEGITYRIPPMYDELAASLNLPTFVDIKVDEHYLRGNLDLKSLATMVAIERQRGFWNRRGLGEPIPQYESLQAKLKSQSVSSVQKFNLKVCDVDLDSLAIPEGAVGKIRRSILSENGTLQVYYVRILEKGDMYEIIERSLAKKPIKAKDPSTIEKEETEKMGKVWINIARRDIPKHHRLFGTIHRKRYSDAKRCVETCQREVKWKLGRSLKMMRIGSQRTRKMARDMLVFWKRIDKEQAELRKKEEKEAAEARKREEELRETKRQQQRLNFLLSQTELYSHFMQNKAPSQASETPPDGDANSLETPPVPANELLSEEDPEEAEMKKEALKAAQNAVFQQKKITNAFDSECEKLRLVNSEGLATSDSSVNASSSIDLLNPSTMPVTSSVQTPQMFKGCLKEYQLKGLQWLVNCYEQGLNGILADEMGLGKTIQAMAFLAHLAEDKNIWGPFLIVAPSSVLNNWVDEVNRFCPALKTIPYWGSNQDRAILRRNITPKRLYKRDSAFHILVTSYQLLVVDEKYLRRVKWQYMVLDEAQAIKSSTSIRWKTLLSFNCRNRLLLTGTPIQNNMAELWALLHFIMPTLFDSHDQFNEWFSKGIENHAEHGGTLNEHQLTRLHAVLKPFMLRRVKKDVISEMTGKTEITVNCNLSSRQQAFYQAIKNKISLAELIDVRSGSVSEKKFVNLMNIVIQLRKVCNHPELFERNEGTTYAYFAEIPNPLSPPPFGELEVIHYPGGRNPITYEMPKLVYQETSRRKLGTVHGSASTAAKIFDVFSPDNIFQSSWPHDKYVSGALGFTRLMKLSPAEVAFLAKASFFEMLLFSLMEWDILQNEIWKSEDDFFEINDINKVKVRASAMLNVPLKSKSRIMQTKLATGPDYAPYMSLVEFHEDRFMSNIDFLRAVYAFIPHAHAPIISVHCTDRNFAYQMVEELHHPWLKRLLLGHARTSEFNGPGVPPDPHHFIREIDTRVFSTEPILRRPFMIFGSSPPVRSFDPAKMLTESGKLQMLDQLLKRLRADNHRVLLFAQMTKMLDILEDYMNYRKYKYLRLDGSSTLTDRRDMVRDFQNRNDIFVFLLSTRAGGLGINLTAADTVIFYESDWNPTLDLQAMDRAHRLGQTKEVTVYRLICKETVEEKILQRASQKNTVQQLVMTGGHVQGDLLQSEDVVSLLLDDAQLEQKLREIPLQVKERQKKRRPTKGILVNADGDVTLEDIQNDQEGVRHDELGAEAENETNDKKRKASSKSQTPRSKKPTKPASTTEPSMNMEEYQPSYLEDDNLDPTPKSKKAKRKKSVNEHFELAQERRVSTSILDCPSPAIECVQNEYGSLPDVVDDSSRNPDCSPEC